MKTFILKDNILHKAFNFPPTLLTYKTESLNKGEQLYKNGVAVPFEAVTENGGTVLKFISDLPHNASYEFCLKKGEKSFEDLDNSNGKITVNDIKGGLFSLVAADGAEFVYCLKTRLKIKEEKSTVSGGAVERIFCKSIVFENGGVYNITFKLKRELDYIEVYENICGLKKGEAKLVISWNNFKPYKRYSPERGSEKIDAYLESGGEFPFRITPFMPKTSWWDLRCACYVGKDLWSGFLLHDLENFDDGEYAVWSSSRTLSLVPYVNRVECPLSNGKRAFMHVLCVSRAPEEIKTHYMRYYSMLHLNKVKDYVLDIGDERDEYPRFFNVDKNTEWGGFYGKRKGEPSPEDMMNILDRDATLFVTPEEIAPVSCRAYRTDWAQTFDLTAKKLTYEQFKRVRAAMALICYVFTSENYYPTKNMFSGHPNFLTDVAGTVAVFASLIGKNHPMYGKWIEYYEIALARNFKYHIRPAVEKWNSSGGRWTENPGAYMMTMLRCIVYDSYVVYKTGGDIPLLYPRFLEFCDFLIGILSPENSEGRRIYPPQGAHAANGAYGGEYGHGYMLSMLWLSDMLKNYAPLLSEYIMHNYKKKDDYYGVIKAAGIYGDSYKEDYTINGGTSPYLTSRKYTGYGYVLRSGVGTPDEMSVILQQIDEGPNYRWGRAAQGGCGEIYYYADSKKYTNHAPEDVGDENRGDVQSCTNFGVLVGHEYKSVGRNDLTEPLIDFGFVKYARVNAGKYSAPYYKYRSVLMAQNRYIAIYDSVGDLKQHGRFTWAQRQGEDFPLIKNVRPGVQGVLTQSGAPVDKSGEYKSKYVQSQTMCFNGEGDFLTVVTHLRNFHDERPLYEIKKCDYGAELVFAQSSDKIFCDSALIDYSCKDFAFSGYCGYINEYGDEKRLAIISGSSIRLGDCKITIPFSENSRNAVSAVFFGGGVKGEAVFDRKCKVTVEMPYVVDARLFVNGKEAPFKYKNGRYDFELNAGNSNYSITRLPVPAAVEILGYSEEDGGVKLIYKGVDGAEEYLVQISEDGENSFTDICKTAETEPFIKLKKGRYHLRVRGVNKLYCGEFSHPYPVNVTIAAPSAPLGLRVYRQGNAYKAVWGSVLGCNKYKLYKITQSGVECVRTLSECQCLVESGEYYVTALNGVGESEPSYTRSTLSGCAEWDNRPDKGFVRDTRSNEHGYSGFDYVNNPNMPILEYPLNGDKKHL